MLVKNRQINNIIWNNNNRYIAILKNIRNFFLQDNLQDKKTHFEFVEIFF